MPLNRKAESQKVQGPLAQGKQGCWARVASLGKLCSDGEFKDDKAVHLHHIRCFYAHILFLHHLGFREG